MKFSSLAFGLAFPIFLSPGLLQARIFAPQPVLKPLEADSQTAALYEFRQSDFDQGKVADITGKAPAGKIQGDWELVSPEELKPAYDFAGKTKGSEKKEGSQVLFSGLEALKEGAFSIDVVLRWNRSGGYVLQVGDGLEMGVLHRGPGLFSLKVPVKATDGSAKVESFDSKEIYLTAPPVQFDDFYTYSLTYDGRSTFQVMIDGVKVFEAKLTLGTLDLGGAKLAVGAVAKWNSVFVGGEIAAVRLTKGVREYQTSAASPATAFERGFKHGWTFDAGTEASPVYAGAIRLTKSDLYNAERGFGWLQKPKGDFDEWLAADRYAATPEIAKAKGSIRIMNYLKRDGVVMPAGRIFKADVPDGLYWVSAEVGHNRGKVTIDILSANGHTIGEQLITDQNTYEGAPVDRSARGLVTVKNGQGIIIEAKTSGNSDVALKSIEILPYEPLPVVFEGGQLKWLGKGDAPVELASVSADLAKQDFPGAVAETKKIADPFIQACVLANVMGRAKLPDPSDLEVAKDLRQLLLRTFREQPGNGAARWLFDSTERFRHGLIAYVDEGGDDVVMGDRFALWLATANQGLQLRPEDPEYWQGRFLAGAGIWQKAVQSSAFDTNGTSDAYLAGSADRLIGYGAPGKLFREVIAANPDFRIARIMLGERLPVVDSWQPPANAPTWAVLQQRLLQRVLGVLHYWVNTKMDDRGLLGGGLGDDCEGLRWWVPAVILADDQDAIRGWKLMANTAWESTAGTGFSRGMDDVEHSAEPTADTLPMLALMNYDTKEMAGTQDKLSRTLPIFRDIWTTVTPDGYRMFKGYHLNNKEINREGDVPYNVRAIKPLMWAAWVDQSKHSELKDLLIAYAKNWRDAIMTEIADKPRGLAPEMIKLDRKAVKEENAANWVNAGYRTFHYPTGYVSHVYELLLAAYEMSGDKSFLEPIQFALAAVRQVPDNDMDPAKYKEGSFEWGVRISAELFGTAGGDYRSLTGDKSYDDVLLRIAPAYIKFRISAEKAKTPEQFQNAVANVEKEINDGLDVMNTNPELRTTMIQSTDRIYVTGSLILDSMATGVATSDNDLRGGEIDWPSFSVTWRGTDGKVAVLVQEAIPTELGILLYNFADKPKSLRPQIWRLEPGNYEVSLVQTDATGFVAGQEIFKRDLAITQRGQIVEFELPSQVPAKLKIVRK